MEDIHPAAEVVIGQEPASFEQLFRTEYASVYKLALRLLGDTGRAEEIAADVFLRLLARPRLLRSERVSGWLHRSAVNASLDELRKQTTRSRVLSFNRPEHSEVMSPHEILERSDRAIRVRSILSTMRPRDVQLLIARSMDFSYEESAAIAGVKKSSVGTHIARAQSIFEERYRRRYGDD